MKNIVPTFVLLLAACSSTPDKTSEFDSLLVGSWINCGTAGYQGRLTGAGSTTTFFPDNRYSISVSDVYDDLECSNKIDSVGVTIEGEFQIVGRSSLGENLYEVNLSNWGNSGYTCFTIMKIERDRILSGQSSYSPKLDCKLPTRRHEKLSDEKFAKYRIHNN